MTARKENLTAKRGAPTKYREDFVRMAFIACSEGGMTDAQLSRLFAVDQSTITIWKRTHPDFFASLKKGRDAYDTEIVEKNLLRRANGYKYTEIIKEKSDAGELEITKTIRKEVAPDVTAQIFWLKNRHPDRWRDAKYLGGSVDIRISHEDALDALE